MTAAGSNDGVRLPSDQDASGRSLGEEELDLLREVIESGTLTSTKGTLVARLERAFAALHGAQEDGGAVVACSSGTTAVHAAVAAIDPEPGEEIVTTAITDMGALAPILYQGAIPAFADVDPRTGNVTADTIEAALSDRTRAIVVTHLFGRPCDMTAIGALAARRGLPIIEDCAQAYLATHRGQLVGTFGALACFSLQQGKHITAGEGGLVRAADAGAARFVRRWVNKGWGYGEAVTDHDWLAPNARLTELQGAVALAQLAKLADGVRNRVEMAERLSAGIEGIEGLETPGADPGDAHSYWRYALLADPSVIEGGPSALATGLRDWAVPSAPRYIQKPAFRCGVFVHQKTFGTSRWPFTLARPEALDYSPERFPGTFRYLDSVLVLPWSERLTGPDVDHIARAIRAGR